MEVTHLYQKNLVTGELKLADDWSSTPSGTGGYKTTISADGNVVGVNLHQEGIYVKICHR